METNKNIRIKDIARQGNVSSGTVDRVLHNRGEVSEETRKKILRIIEEMDYQPNILASTLASKKQPMFVTLLPTPLSADGYWTKPVLGINRRFAELLPYGIRLKSFTFNQYEPGDFVEKANRILALQPDGILLAPFFLKESMKFINALKENNIPFVFIDSDIPGQGQLAYVGQNSFQCGYLSGRLISTITKPGRPLLVLHFAKEMDNQNHLLQREKGFYEWFRVNESGRSIKTFEMCVSGTEKCDQMLKRILVENNPSGIFVTNSKVYMAAEMMEKMGLRDVHLIGHDLLKENVKFLRDGIVDFLICQRPEEQGYDSLDKLFQFVVHKSNVREYNYTPIDVIMKENVDYYNEFK